MNRFEHALRIGEARRHLGLFRAALRDERARRRERSWDHDDGFLEPAAAAKAMQMSVDQVVTLAAQGMLETRGDGDWLRIRPAVVSVLGVNDPRMQS